MLISDAFSLLISPAPLPRNLLAKTNKVPLVVEVTLAAVHERSNDSEGANTWSSLEV